ncbi:hypothetical protein B0H19DRAFT_1167837 [Mycena capillaripes]|nr:hypothetical protein B0H19DRAFT_1167837 [Mycena capillaripes]
MSTSKMSQHTVRVASQSLRNVHSSSATRAAAAEVPLTFPPTLDIFDVPVRLRQQSGVRAPALEQARQARPSHGQAAASLSPRSLNPRTPTSLPNPLVFEGPAGRRPVMGNHDEFMEHRASSYAPRQGSEPVVTIFDGPAHSGGRSQRPLMYARNGGRSVRLSLRRPSSC